MTHLEASEQLAALALDALDAEAAEAVAAHVAGCASCASELASLEATAAELGGAVSPVAPPARLRARLFADASTFDTAQPATLRTVGPSPVRRSGRRLPEFVRGAAARPAWSLAAALALALIATAVFAAIDNQRQARELALDRAALALLTSTETVEHRLTPPPGAGVPAASHGHWFHRPGVNTQVVVGESLPPPEHGQYVVWLQRGGVWQRGGDLPLDERGNGRLVLLGWDGQDVGEVEIRLEATDASSPSPKVVLRYP